MTAKVILLIFGVSILAGCNGDAGQAATPEQTVQRNKAHQTLEEKGG